MSIKYPFLYFQKNNKKLIEDCMFTTFLSSYFIHFAGNWNESSFIKYSKDFNYIKKRKLIELNSYLKKNIKAKVRSKKLLLN